jgi:hypothetical protein
LAVASVSVLYPKLVHGQVEERATAYGKGLVAAKASNEIQRLGIAEEVESVGLEVLDQFMGPRFAYLLGQDGDLLFAPERFQVQLQRPGRVLLPNRGDRCRRLPVGHPAGEDEPRMIKRAETLEDEVDGGAVMPRRNLVEGIDHDQSSIAEKGSGISSIDQLPRGAGLEPCRRRKALQETGLTHSRLSENDQAFPAAQELVLYDLLMSAFRRRIPERARHVDQPASPSTALGEFKGEERPQDIIIAEPSAGPLEAGANGVRLSWI